MVVKYCVITEQGKEKTQISQLLQGLSDQGNVVTVKLTINLDHGSESSDRIPTVPVKVVFSLLKNYPESLPDISIFSEHFDRQQTSKVKSEVEQSSQDLLGFPMMLSLLSLIEECLQEELACVTANLESTRCVSTVSVIQKDTVWTSVLHIDHMRSKNKYCKTLEKWCSDLCLNGRLYFCHRLILVLLQGEIENIKDFIVRLKTTSIDIDSKGHSCKERMMTPLCEEEIPTADLCRFNDFKKCEVLDPKDIEQEFDNAGLSKMYLSIAPSIKGYL